MLVAAMKKNTLATSSRPEADEPLFGRDCTESEGWHRPPSFYVPHVVRAQERVFGTCPFSLFCTYGVLAALSPTSSVITGGSLEDPVSRQNYS